MGADRRHLGLLVACAACAASPYAPYPLQVAGPLPDGAFAACRDTLLRHYGSLHTVDEQAFLLQTEWLPVADPAGEQRASVFRDDSGDLAVVVELRRITDPMLGLPTWTVPRGWDDAERELAERLRAVLQR